MFPAPKAAVGEGRRTIRTHATKSIELKFGVGNAILTRGNWVNPGRCKKSSYQTKTTFDIKLLNGGLIKELMRSANKLDLIFSNHSVFVN